LGLFFFFRSHVNQSSQAPETNTWSCDLIHWVQIVITSFVWLKNIDSFNHQFSHTIFIHREAFYLSCNSERTAHKERIFSSCSGSSSTLAVRENEKKRKRENERTASINERTMIYVVFLFFLLFSSDLCDKEYHHILVINIF
jgi:hypothetical protein